MYRRYVKRIIDVILSLAGLILASWLYLLIMIAIEIDDPGPVFFSQKRGDGVVEGGTGELHRMENKQ